MAHNESFSLHPEQDESLIRWLNAPSRKGRKSSTVKQALYLLKEIEHTINLANFGQKIEVLPEIFETVLRIENMLRDGNFSINPDGDISQSGTDRQTALSMIDQMEELED